MAKKKWSYAVMDEWTGEYVRWHALYKQLREWAARMNACEGQIRYTVERIYNA